jgi:UDP-3-O-[3-hydroxymyristoyl] glucosamine N-acyltransferase
MIHPTAIIYPGTRLGVGVSIAPYAVVGMPPVRGLTARDPGEPGETVVGDGTHIGAHAVIYAGATIGLRCLIGDHSHIREGVRLGTGVRLATHVSVNYEATIDHETVIMQATHITGRMRIGSRCFIGPLVVTMNHREPRYGYVDEEIAPPWVGDGVLIGGGAVLCPGVVIGDNAVIGAGVFVRDGVSAHATLRRAMP